MKYRIVRKFSTQQDCNLFYPQYRYKYWPFWFSYYGTFGGSYYSSKPFVRNASSYTDARKIIEYHNGNSHKTEIYKVEL